MIRTVSRAFILALTLAALAAGCGNPTSPTVTTTTTTTTTSTSGTTYTTVTEPLFTGTLTAGQTLTSQPFTATPGTITVTLSKLETTLLPAIGLGLGIYDDTAHTCTLVVSTTAAQQGTVLYGTASITHSFCVQIWDVNGFAAGYTQPFEITISHQAVAGT